MFEYSSEPILVNIVYYSNHIIIIIGKYQYRSYSVHSSQYSHLVSNALWYCVLQKYFQSGPSADTKLTIEWTNQHGCGGNENNDPHKLNCNMVIQYMVQDYDGTQAGTSYLKLQTTNYHSDDRTE